jgi:hypothetical protein
LNRQISRGSLNNTLCKRTLTCISIILRPVHRYRFQEISHPNNWLATQRTLIARDLEPRLDTSIEISEKPDSILLIC